MDAVMALTLSRRIDEVERIDRLTAMAEARRDTMLCDLERRREVLAAKVRTALDAAEETEVGPAQADAQADAAA